MQLFFAPDVLKGSYTLNEEESKHCIRVLRLTEGAEIALVDGRGGLFRTRIVDPNPKRCRVEVTDIVTGYGKRNFYLHIAIAPTKNIERFEWFLEKTTEIGIDEITPLLCERSERKTINPERLERIIVSAMKQSVKAYLPRLNGMVNFEKFIDGNHPDQGFIAHCNIQNLPPLKSLLIPNETVTVLIGPEGDFSPSEVQLAVGSGFREVSLGQSRLRTETAGVVACHTVTMLNE